MAYNIPGRNTASSSAAAARPIHLVFLGCGLVTGKHSQLLSRHRSDVRCFYASRDAAKSKTYNHRFGGGGSFEGYAAALSDPQIEVAVVATPPATHLDLTLSGLRAGKHVIVEKPAFLHADDFDIVRKVQAETGRRVFVAENYCYKPLAAQLRKIIASGVLGEILFVYVNALKYQKTGNWRDHARLAGGGALFEGGVHWINLMGNLGLTIRSAHGIRMGASETLERSVLIGIQYAEGAAGVLAHSWEAPSLLRGLRLSKIYGRRGSTTFESNGLFILVNGCRKRVIFPGVSDIGGYHAMWQDFIRCLRTGAQSRMTLEVAERDLRLIEAIYRSASEIHRG